jgi:hypothetical protein
VADAVVKINLQYDRDVGEFFPKVENVFIEGLHCGKSKYPLYLVGLPQARIGRVVVRDCVFENVERPSVITNVDDVELHDFEMLPKDGADHD